MILKEFVDVQRTKVAKLTRVLAENYNFKMNFEGMTAIRASRLIESAKMKAAVSKTTHDRIKFSMVAESLEAWMAANTTQPEAVVESLDDESVDSAKVIIAAQELSDKIQSMIEDTAKMQVQDLLPIVDAMKTEIGTAEADAFGTSADEALGSLVDALKAAKESYDSAISVAQGNEAGTDMDMDVADMGDSDETIDMDDVSIDDDMDDLAGDEFGGDDANMGGNEPSGREMKDEI